MKTILFVQGLGMTKHEYKNSFDEIAARLKIAGFKTVQFDFPIFKKRKTYEMALTTRAAFLERMAAKYKPDGIISQSFGAATSLISHLPTVKTQLLISPALSPVDSIKRVYEEVGMKINYSGETSMPRSSGETTTVNRNFWKDVEDFDDIAVAKGITVLTCILHGDQDTKIPVDVVKKFYESIPSKKILKIYPGGDHGINDVPRPIREEFLQDIVNWFKETI